MEPLLSSPYFTYLVLPILIFCARICDVTFGTIRIILVSKGIKRIAPILGFIEVFIWILAISQIMANLNNWVCYFAYAAGFATGNYVGMIIEERLAMGTLILRIMISGTAEELVKALNKEDFGATTLHAEGSHGKVDLVYTIVNRKDLSRVEDIIKGFNPNAFYSIEEVKKVNKGVFPHNTASRNAIANFWRKGDK
jgi:Uncharacterized protein conserved in bacteria